MSNELKQLNQLRRQAARIRSYLVNLCNVPNLTLQQKEAAEVIHTNFKILIVLKIRDKRAEYNDDEPDKFDLDLDGYNNSLDCPRNASIIIVSLSRELRELKRIAESVCDSNIDPLIMNLKDFWSFDFFEMKKLF